MPKLLITVPVCWKYEYPFAMGRKPVDWKWRVDTLRRTWWNDAYSPPDVTGFMFYGRGESEALLSGNGAILREDEVILDCPDDYDHLCEKTLAMIRWAVDHHDFEFLLRADDDTAVDVPGVLHEITTDPSELAGQKIASYCYGGTGFILSRKAAEIVATTTYPMPKHHSADDVWIGGVLNAAGFFPHNYEGHLETITKHCRMPGEMDAWYDKVTSKREISLDGGVQSRSI